MHRPSDRDFNWLSPVQGESPPMQVKEPSGNLDMVTCRLSSCNPECAKYTCRQYSKEGLVVYIEKKERIPLKTGARGRENCCTFH